MAHRSGCLLCGAALSYEREQSRTCALCGAAAEASAVCGAGHYVCDRCHALGPVELIHETCRGATERDPVALAVRLMRSPRVAMHGPEHHFLVPAVLLTAAANVLGDGRRQEWLDTARTRAAAILGGFCGWGVCGAGVGVGLFVSILKGATPLSGRSWRQANQATARALATIAASGGPRCCKRDSLLAIDDGVAVARAELGLELERGAAPVCEWHDLNRECRQRNCPFYPAAAVAVTPAG
jgi:hypothetical protein